MLSQTSRAGSADGGVRRDWRRHIYGPIAGLASKYALRAQAPNCLGDEHANERVIVVFTFPALRVLVGGCATLVLAIDHLKLVDASSAMGLSASLSPGRLGPDPIPPNTSSHPWRTKEMPPCVTETTAVNHPFSPPFPS